ncbi:MAG: DUF1002 domain-containing protein [Candidatus Choladocola sp.]|nr:DUF1002 domain-containing protein [Candidatus Choladocola sp.]
MKKRLFAVLMAAFCIAAAIPSASVLADGQKVVTLGADLTADQKQAILRYFGVEGQNIQTLTITNQDERNHLGSYVPLEQIGTKTFSCALVNPTSSGGIQVKTANLSWVTSNMIATTLSTSGVVNCEVLAAAPFEVSGTGALTGILMAYENAVGTNLDAGKKEVATQELITTATIANNIGQVEATEIVNESKMQVIQGDVISGNDIDVIINEVADQENISLSDEDRELLADLLEQIAEQDYDYEEMKETLERVESNLDDLKNSAEENEDQPETEADADGETETPETLPSDSILMNTDDSALGESTVFDATDEAAIAETDATLQPETGSVEQIPADTTSDGIDITTSDTYSDTPSDGASETDPEAGTVDIAAPEGTVDGTADVNTDGTADGTADGSSQILLSDMTFAPVTSDMNGFKVYPAGQNRLTVYFRRSDIVAGSGTLTVYNGADSSMVESISLSDTAKVSFKPLSEEDQIELGWTEGSKAEIYLGIPLSQSSTWFVILSEDAFRTADGTGSSEAITDSYSWVIQTSEYGFAIDQSTMAGAVAGNTASAQIMMDGTAAAYACIENLDESVITFDQTEFWASGSFNATFLQMGETGFDVSFYDENGNYLDGIHYTIEIR